MNKVYDLKNLRARNVQKVRINGELIKIFEVWNKVDTRLFFECASYAHYKIRDKKLTEHFFKNRNHF